MIPRAASITMLLLVPLAIAACNRSEELGHPPDGGAGSGGGGISSGGAGSGGEGGSAKNDAGAGGSCGKVSCALPNGEACGAGSACSSAFCVRRRLLQQRLRGDLHGVRRGGVRRHLRAGALLLAAQRGELRGGERVRERVLRERGLLQQRLRGDLHGVREPWRVQKIGTCAQEPSCP